MEAEMIIKKMTGVFSIGFYTIYGSSIYIYSIYVDYVINPLSSLNNILYRLY